MGFSRISISSLQVGQECTTQAPDRCVISNSGSVLCLRPESDGRLLRLHLRDDQCVGRWAKTLAVSLDIDTQGPAVGPEVEVETHRPIRRAAGGEALEHMRLLREPPIPHLERRTTAPTATCPNQIRDRLTNNL